MLVSSPASRHLGHGDVVLLVAHGQVVPCDPALHVGDALAGDGVREQDVGLAAGHVEAGEGRGERFGRSVPVVPLRQALLWMSRRS